MGKDGGVFEYFTSFLSFAAVVAVVVDDAAAAATL